MYRASIRCASLKHEVSINNIMTIMEGNLEAASNFIYAVRSYSLKKYDIAQNYATDALTAASCFDDNLNNFVTDLATLFLIILGKFNKEQSICKLVKIVNSIPFIPLVWSTLIKCWKKFDNIDLTEGDDILKLDFWNNNTCPKTSLEVLLALAKFKDDVSCSYYVKEVILNTCGFVTEWVKTIWDLDKIECFSFTITELTILTNKIGPLSSIIKPISTSEAYKMINDFVTETSNEKLDRSGTCASCGHCVSTTSEKHSLDFDENVKAIFNHKNVCLATWDPHNIYLTNINSDDAHSSSLFFKRNDCVLLNFKGKSYQAKVIFQRRGEHNEPGKVALKSDEGVGYFPHHPICSFQADCPYYTQKHGFYSENGVDYILLDKYNYNVEFNFNPDDHKTSLNIGSWI